MALIALAILVLYGTYKLTFENAILSKVTRDASRVIVTKVINWIGVIAFVSLVLILLPGLLEAISHFEFRNNGKVLTGQEKTVQKPSDKSVQLWAPKDVKEIFESYVPHSWYSIYSLKDYSNLGSTQTKSELSKRNLIIFNTIPYNKHKRRKRCIGVFCIKLYAPKINARKKC